MSLSNIRTVLPMLLASFAINATAQAQPVPAGIDPTFVPADAFGVFAAQPQKLMSTKEFEMFPTEVISAACIKEFGFDAADVTQVVMVFDNLFQPRPPEPGVIVRFSKPVAADKIFRGLMQGATPAMTGGTPYLKAANDRMPSLCVIDGRTALLGTEPMLLRMLAAKPTETSALHQKLRVADAGAHVLGMLSVDAVRVPIQQLQANAPTLPPPLANLLTLPNDTSAVELRMYLGTKLRSSIVFHATNAAAAPQIEKKLSDGMQFGRQMLEMQVAQQFGRSEDPVEQALAKYAQRMIKLGFESLKLQTVGDRVGLTVDANVDVATIGVLTSLLLPAVSQAKSAARRAQAQNNLRQFSIAMLSYEAAQNHLPARANFTKDGKPLLSWRVHLLPYLEEQALYQQFHLDEPWDSDHNRKLIARMPAIFQSPDSPQAEGKTRFVVPTGKGMIFGEQTGMKTSRIIDGVSKTILVVEVGAEKAVTWTKPDDLEIDLEKPWAAFGNATSPRGFSVGFADGSVRTLSAELIDAKVLRALLTCSGGEAIQASDFDH